MGTPQTDSQSPAELDILVFGEDAARDAVVRLLGAATGCHAHVLRPADSGPLSEPAAVRCVLLAAQCDPEPGAVQALGVLAHALAAPGLVVLAQRGEEAAQRLFAAGAHDVLELGSLPPEGLARALRASVRREVQRQEVVRQGRRAALKSDALAALAAAVDRSALFAAFADGLAALGALATVCWEDCGGTYQPLGPSTTGSGPEAGEAVHQAAAAAALGHATWHVLGRGDGEAPAARAYIPVAELGRAPAVLEVACAHVPTEEERALLAELAQHAEAALARLEALRALRVELAAYQQLLGEVSRDLRDPLSTLLVGAQVLSERADTELAPGLSRLARAASVASRVVDDLRTFAHGHGEVSLDPAPGDLYELLTAAVSDARARFGPRRTIQLALPAETGMCVFDLPRMEQAFGNFIAYALTHSTPGSELCVRASGDDHALYVEVEGALQSRARHELPTLLDVDVRAASVAEYGSGGIGLFIAARLVDAHRGRVWLESRQEGSSTLCIQLPRRAALDRTAQVARLRVPASAPSQPVQGLSGAMLALSRGVRAEPLRSALALWNAARDAQALPHPLGLARRSLLPLLPDMVWVSVEEVAGEACFRVDELGARLERRLGRSLRGQRVAPTLDTLATSQHAAYRRCWEIRGPAYDYVRQRGPDGWWMERLLLPFSRDGGRHVHQLAGVIVFSGG